MLEPMWLALVIALAAAVPGRAGSAAGAASESEASASESAASASESAGLAARSAAELSPPIQADRVPACAGAARSRPVISLDVRDGELAATFRLLAEAAHTNIVVADDVHGTVTLRVTDVPWLTVLCTIVRSKALAAYRDGPIYTVQAR